jgi:molecular chaperone HtpG
MTAEKMPFQAEVARLLQLMVNAVYSDKEVFLRELISNASDACDKLRYQALTQPELTADDPEFRIRIAVDPQARTIEVADNGIGMTRDELIRDLGTIARSGTSAFVEQLSGEGKKDMALIGQFGVGFYSAFMVAERVEATSRKAGAAEAWTWSSDGAGEFTVAEAAREGRGTSIVLHLRKGEDEWLKGDVLRRVVRTHSDHVGLPVVLSLPGEKDETVNAASALWLRPKKEISEQQYKEFYRHVSHGFDDPWLTIHYRAEGKLEYSVLLFAPSNRPYDLFDPARACRVKLYVRRVFITEQCEGLLPSWLRFLRGVVDSEDLPLNLSREMLQQSPHVARMGAAIAKRVLAELKKQAEADAAGFARFWENFGAVLKEGLYEDAERREELLKLALFRSTHGEGWTSLADYVARMKQGQTAIYTVAGDDLATLRQSPQLEGYRAKGVEVLLLADPIDDFWLPAVDGFEGKPFRSVTRGAAELKEIKAAEAEKPKADGDLRDADVATVIAALKQSLGDAVKDVRASERLTDSAVCLVADEHDMDMHLARMLKAHGQLKRDASRILEVNPRHDLVRRLCARIKEKGACAEVEDAAHLLLDQARIVEGEPLPDPAAFSRRLALALARGLAG